MNIFKFDLSVRKVPPAIPRVITLVIPIKPFFVTRGQRIPNLNQVSCIRISRAEDAFTLDVIELETLAVNRGEVDCNGIEVAFREIVGDIADVMGREK